MALYGVGPLTDAFRDHLRKDVVQSRVTILQMLGKLEIYLVQEFAQFVWHNSDYKRLCLLNLGHKGQRKFDMAILKNDEIDALIEAKYFHNMNRFNPTDNKRDEIKGTLEKLKEQCLSVVGNSHAGYDLNLKTRNKKPIYGLIFVSHACCGGGNHNRKEYRKSIEKAAGDLGFKYHDHKKPYLGKPIYEDIALPGIIDGKEWRVSLYSALWRIGS